MGKQNEEEKLILIKDEDTYILHNASHTIISEGAELSEVYDDYIAQSNKVKENFTRHNLEYSIGSEVRSGVGSQNIVIEKSSGLSVYIFIVFFVIVGYGLYSLNIRGAAKDLSYEMQGAVTSIIRSLPATIKKTLLYTKNDESYCYPCIVEEIVDGINRGTDQMPEAELKRLRGKIDALKQRYGVLDEPKECN